MEDSMQIEHAARVFKALGNTSRLEIVLHLAERECTVKELVDFTGLSQPLVSQHLGKLREVHVVKGEREGRATRYSIADAHVTHVIHDALAHAQEGERHD
mgnify:FL=1